MVNPMVERATSDVLVGPDWAMNIGICDACNRDPGQAKDVVKGIKKRVGNKNAKVQLLALTLLETIVKNCGDLVHKHVAKRDLLHDMVKIVKKKPDLNVKEKILILIDTWQEAFGGARARYPQYFAAYNELLHMGVLFPKRTERSPPVFTPLQTQPLMRNPENGNDAVESSSSAEAEVSTFSSTEIQKARDIMVVLAEMLIAIDPETKEGVRQEVVLDLVMQCRTYKKRVVHLVNSTLSTAGAGAGADTRFLAPIITNGPSATPGKFNPKFDLLSGDDFSTETAQNFLAIVPLGEPEPATPVSQQNVMSQNNKPQNAPAGQTYSSSPQFQRSQHFSSKQPSFNLNGSLPNMVPPQSEPTSQYAQGSIPAAGQTYAASPKFEESQHFPPQQPSFHPNGNIDNMVTPRFKSMSLYTHGSNPVAGRRYSSLPQVQQSQHFPSQQSSFNPNGSLPAILPPQYEPRSPYAQGSSPTAEQTYPSPQFQQSQHFPSQPPSYNPNGSLSLTNIIPLQCEPISSYSQESNPAWNGHTSQQQQPSSLVYGKTLLNGHTPQQQHPSSPIYGAQTRHEGLPPPPWEAQPADSNQSGGMHYPQPQGLQTLGNNNNQAMGMYMQQQIIGTTPSPMRHEAIHLQQHITDIPPSPMSHKVIHPQQQITGGPPSPVTHETIHLEQIPQQQFQAQHTMGVLPHYQMAYMYPQQMYSNPMARAYGYGGGYRYSYGYTQPQHAQFLDHRMSWLSVRDDGFLNYASPSISNGSDLHMPSLNPSNPEDKLFEDLVDLTNGMPNKTTGEKK